MTLAFERLAAEVCARRADLRLSQADVVARGGPSELTLRKIEKAQSVGGYRSATLNALDRALEWPLGTSRAILNHLPPPSAEKSTPVSVPNHSVGPTSSSGRDRVIRLASELLPHLTSGAYGVGGLFAAKSLTELLCSMMGPSQTATPTATNNSQLDSSPTTPTPVSVAQSPPRLPANWDPNRLLTLEEFCHWAGVSLRTFRQWCAVGTAPPRMKFGKHSRVLVRDALAWAESRKVRAV